MNRLVPAPHPSSTHAGSPCPTVAAVIAIAVAVEVAEVAAAGRAV